jgi:hypothetical protein
MQPISPELVLIDPDLARDARAQLGEPGKSNGGVSPPPIATAGRRRRVASAGAVARAVPSTGHLPPGRTREARVRGVEAGTGSHHLVRPKLLLFAVGLVGFTLGVLLPPVGNEGDPGPSRKPLAAGEEQPASVTPRPTTPTVSAATVDPRKEATQTESGPAPRSAERASAKAKERRRQIKSSEPAAAPTTGGVEAKRAPHVRVPTRLFVWLPNRGASYYHVKFLKGARTVFEAWPTDARVTVPLRGTFRGRSFAFTSGRYRWIVRPAVGPRSEARYGEPIVRSTWVVGP